MNVKVGNRFRLVDHIGYKPETDPNDEFTAFRNAHHPLFAGQIGEVVATGIRYGDQTEDHAILEYEHRELVNHAVGKEVPEHVPGGYKRMHGATEAQLADRTVYEPIEDADTPRDLGHARPEAAPAPPALSVVEDVQRAFAPPVTGA